MGKTDSGQQPAAGWKVPTLPEFIDAASKAPRWMVPGLILDSAAIVVSGQKKRAGKTYFAMTAAVGMAAGVRFGMWTPPGRIPVVFVEEEGPKGPTSDRLLAVCKSLEVDYRQLTNMHFSHHAGLKLDNKKWRKDLAGKVRETGAKLLVLDAMGYMYEGDENKTQDMQRARDTIREIQTLGCSVMMLHHLDKMQGEDNKSDPDRQVRGSGVATDQYDTHIALRKYDRTSPTVDMHVLHKDYPNKRLNIRWRYDNDPITERVLQADMRVEDPEETAKAVFHECKRRLEPLQKYSPTRLAALWNLSPRKTKLMTEEMEARHILLMKDGSYWLVTPTSQGANANPASHGEQHGSQANPQTTSQPRVQRREMEQLADREGSHLSQEDLARISVRKAEGTRPGGRGVPGRARRGAVSPVQPDTNRGRKKKTEKENA